MSRSDYIILKISLHDHILQNHHKFTKIAIQQIHLNFCQQNGRSIHLSLTFTYRKSSLFEFLLFLLFLTNISQPQNKQSILIHRFQIIESPLDLIYILFIQSLQKYRFLKTKKVKTMNSKISAQVNINLFKLNKYANEDFKNLYRQIKTLNLLNQLYDSDAISHDQFEQQEKQIMSRYKRLKSHLAEFDLEAFAKLYNIEKEYKRITAQNMKDSNPGSQKQLMSLCLTIGSKFPELSDTLHTSKQTREVKDVINLLSEMVHLLTKYKKLVKKPTPDLVKSIQKLTSIYDQCKKKKISEQFTAMQYYDLEDAISKLWLQFSHFS